MVITGGFTIGADTAGEISSLDEIDLKDFEFILTTLGK